MRVLTSAKSKTPGNPPDESGLSAARTEPGSYWFAGRTRDRQTRSSRLCPRALRVGHLRGNQLYYDSHMYGHQSMGCVPVPPANIILLLTFGHSQ
jgi:hypothetical protein